MTSEEKAQQMADRNAAIVAYYLAGNKLSAVASRFRLGRQRTLQILQKAGAWRPYERTGRTKFLGVSVSEETKAALKAQAKEQGVSVSKFASDALDAAVGVSGTEQ